LLEIETYGRKPIVDWYHSRALIPDVLARTPRKLKGQEYPDMCLLDVDTQLPPDAFTNISPGQLEV
jgi:hypothetical protein